MKKILLILIIFVSVGFSVFGHRSNMSKLSRKSADKANAECISFEEWYYEHKIL